MNPQKTVFLTLLFFFLVSSFAQDRDERELLWVDLKPHSFLKKSDNLRIKKDIMSTLVAQKKYQLVIAGNKNIESVKKVKTSVNIIDFKIEEVSKNLFHVTAAIKDLKGKKIIKRVRKRFVPREKLLIISDKVAKLLFFDLEKPSSSVKKQKDRKKAEKIVIEEKELARRQLDFKKQINAIKSGVKTKINTITEDKKTKRTDKEKKIASKDLEKNNKKDDKKKIAKASGESLKTKKESEEKKEKTIPAIVAPRKAFHAQFGWLNQIYEIRENAETSDEFNVNTTLEFLSFRLITLRQLTSSIDALDWLAAFEFGYPLTEAAVQVEKYTKLTLGLNLVMFRSYLMPVSLSGMISRDNLSFANIPEPGEGIRVSDISVTWGGAKITVGGWRRWFALSFSQESSIMSDPTGDGFLNAEFDASRTQFYFISTSDYLVSDSTLSAGVTYTDFVSTGRRKVIGTDFSLIVLFGLIF